MDGFAQFTERNVDIVMCIDGTGSMKNCIQTVKENAKRFHSELKNALEEARSSVSSLRIKVIVFRDYIREKEPMVESEFFELPEDTAEFDNYLGSIKTFGGGGDGPENGLEAIYYAMKSDFYTGPKDRQIIILFTDDDALELKERASYPSYPTKMADMSELQTMWACSGAYSQSSDFKLRERLKRMVFFAPSKTKYEDLSMVLNRTWFVPVKKSNGLADVSFEDIIKLIVNSATAI